MPDQTSAVAVISGSGASLHIPDLESSEKIDVNTPYGQPSSPIYKARIAGCDVFILFRHGAVHKIPPHKINYRANISALAELGCDIAISIATVGGIRGDLKPGDLMVPDQIIDYTWGRDSTFYDGDDGNVGHLETALPYCTQLREMILRAGEISKIDVSNKGVYAVTQGPRFETAAEIDRIERDGGDIVGMTGLPEAALAAERQICYACVALIVNQAAGRGDQAIDMDELSRSWKTGYKKINRLLGQTIELLNGNSERPFKLNSHVMEM